MNKNEKWQASQDFKRVNDVTISADFCNKIEQIALAMAASGRMSEFKLLVSSLAKVNQQDDSNLLMQAMAAKLGVLPEPTEKK